MKVRFHLPDFADNFKFNLMFLTMLENSPELFREGVEVASVYGVFPPIDLERRPPEIRSVYQGLHQGRYQGFQQQRYPPPLYIHKSHAGEKTSQR